jgi:hypothetical protein
MSHSDLCEFGRNGTGGIMNSINDSHIYEEGEEKKRREEKKREMKEDRQ